MNQNTFELSYYIPRIHMSVTENDVKRVINNVQFGVHGILPSPTRVDFNQIPNNKHFKSAFVYHLCTNQKDINAAKNVEQIIKSLSNKETDKQSQLNLKVNCGIITPNNPNAYWILLPNYNQLSENAKYMADELKEVGEEVCSLLYILAYSGVAIPSDIELYMEDKPTSQLSVQENENLIAEKLQNAFETKEKLEKLVLKNNLILPEDLNVLYMFDHEYDVITTY